MPTDKHQPPFRRLLWLKCSGALREMKNNPGYYEHLKQVKNSYPNGAFTTIECDLPRTYTDEEEGSEKLKIKIEILRNVLETYVKRNPRVGYL